MEIKINANKIKHEDLTMSTVLNGHTIQTWFAAVWRTPNQTRDLLVEFFHPVTTVIVDKLKIMALRVEEERKANPEMYTRCSRCYGHHGQLGNIDKLCEQCEVGTAIYRYDLLHNVKTI